MAAKREFSVKVWHVVLLSIIVGALLTWGILNSSREVDRLRSELRASADVIMYHTIEVDSLTEQVAEAKLYIWEKEQHLVMTQAQVERLKKLRIRDVRLIGELEIRLDAFKDSLAVRDADTVIRYVERVNDVPMIEVPAFFESDEPWLYMWGNINIAGTGSLGMHLKETPIHITLGSRGVFKKEYVSAISSPNPYITITKNDIQVVQPKITKPTAIAGTVGLLVGAVTTLLLTR